MLKIIGKAKMALALLVAAALACYGGYSYYVKAAADTSGPQTVKAATGDIRNTVSATGTVKPVNSVDVSSKINGRIVEVKVKENDWVKEGDVLFILDSKQYQSDIDRTEATLNNASAHLARMDSLLRNGAVARQEFDSARRDYLVAKAAYDTSASNLADTIIKAPVSGLVVGKPTPAGQTVAPGISTPMVLMTIADMSIMQSETLVDESDIGQVRLGQKVDFTVDAYASEVFRGVVSLISRKAETTNNVVYYKVYVDVLDSRQLLFPNMTSRVTIYTAEAKNVLTLPLSAVRETKEGHFAYKALPGGKTEEVKVSLGLRGDDRIEITGGLNAGDSVLLKASAASAPANRAGNMRGPRLF
ncbi:MAG: efflux RND transporter periplasmic adaptor subunit [Acidaminococcales bacterium]|jgi:HlyD family secretion protein|nr:efflux RND transporter periplasmic adaptor subunit [Acidaminococcales bacterium]